MTELEDYLKKYGLDTTQITNIYYALDTFHQIKTYNSFKSLLNTYPHPTFKDVEDFNNDHKNKVVLGGIDYAGVDDRMCEIICGLNRGFKEEVYRDIISYLNWITQYEREEKTHTHKGGIFYNIGQFFFYKGRIEEALLFIHRGLKEDHMKHQGKYNFPKVDSYKMITLDKTLNNPVINIAINFIKKEILGSFAFSDLYTKFLSIFVSIYYNYFLSFSVFVSLLLEIIYFIKLKCATYPFELIDI